MIKYRDNKIDKNMLFREIVCFYGVYDIFVFCVCYDIMILLIEKKWKIRS